MMCVRLTNTDEGDETSACRGREEISWTFTMSFFFLRNEQHETTQRWGQGTNSANKNLLFERRDVFFPMVLFYYSRIKKDESQGKKLKKVRLKL
jgi:hypothetical protein